MKFLQFKLANGLQVIAELNPSVYSVAAGFWVRAGSRDESPEVAGVSHFLEHMAFKGNDRYSADDVNRIFDEIGASYNASTSEEVTTFYAAVLPEYVDKTVELLSCLMQPSLREDDFNMEKQVILEEIAMYEDLPAYTVYDTLMATHFRPHPLANSVLGSVESITALTVEQMRAYHAEKYRAGNLTLVIAGNIDEDTLRQVVEKHCAAIPEGSCSRSYPPFVPEPRTAFVTRAACSQQHIMQMGVAPNNRDTLRLAAGVLAVIVGDDDNSRLHWEIVDPGHAESADLGYHEYDGLGAWMSYLSCLPEDTEVNLQRLQNVFDSVSAGGIRPDELEQARNKVASRIVLRGERPMGRLTSLGGDWLYRNEYRSVADDLADVRRVSQDDVRRVLDEFPLRMQTTVGVGPLEAIRAEAAS